MRTRTIYGTDGAKVAEYRDGELVFSSMDTANDAGYYVMPDYEPWKDPSGVVIHSRAQWKEHLKKTGTVEMGHSDIKTTQEQWGKRRDAHAERLTRAQGMSVKSVDVPASMECIEPAQRSRLNVEILNKLHGRPTPGRKELIKLTLDTARDLKRK